jgi:hypothetical protein
MKNLQIRCRGGVRIANGDLCRKSEAPTGAGAETAAPNEKTANGTDA